MAELPSARVAPMRLLLTAFLAGFAVMVVEMAAVRAVAPYFGQSAYVWTNVIGVVLAALAAGYVLGGRLADRRPSPTVLWAVLLAGGGLCLLLPWVVRPVSRGLLPADLAAQGATGLLEIASLVAALVLFAPPLFVVAAASPLVVKLLARGDDVGRAAGLAFGWSTLGSILGTFTTTGLLVPHLGTRLTLALAGALLAGTGAVGLLLGRPGRRRRAVAGGALLACLLLPAAVARLGPLKGDPGAGREQVEERETAYQYVRVVREQTADGPAVLMLQFDEAEGQAQSVAVEGTVLTAGRYYDVVTALCGLCAGPDEPLDVLVIGLAAGTIPRQLRRFHPRGLRVTAAEIDPQVLDVARRRFGLDDGGTWLEVLPQDGRVVLNALADRPRFDVVVLDAFARQDEVPFHLATREAFAAARDALRERGLIVVNVAARGPDARVLAALEATVADVFGEAWRVRVDGWANFVLYAVKGGTPDFDRLRARPAGSHPEEEALGALARDVAARSVRVRAGERGVPPLTDDRAPIEILTAQDARRAQRDLADD